MSGVSIMSLIFCRPSKLLPGIEHGDLFDGRLELREETAAAAATGKGEGPHLLRT